MSSHLTRMENPTKFSIITEIGKKTRKAFGVLCRKSTNHIPKKNSPRTHRHETCMQSLKSHLCGNKQRCSRFNNQQRITATTTTETIIEKLHIDKNSDEKYFANKNARKCSSTQKPIHRVRRK